jgi:hypothetical protein
MADCGRTDLLGLFQPAAQTVANTTALVFKQEVQLRHSIWTNSGKVLTVPRVLASSNLHVAS